MKWVKKGLLFSPDKNLWWQQSYGMLPTPIFLEKEGILRIYFSSACKENFSRITYMDVDPSDPSRIIHLQQDFILDIGEDGTFDDCGIIPTSILYHNNRFFLYYSGYQRHFKVPYSILSGVAVSDDGKQFKRIRTTPFLERTEEEMNIRSAPFVIYDDGKFHMWYTAGKGWKTFESGLFAGRNMPVYVLKYGTSENGFDFAIQSKPVFELEENEFGISRPYITRQDGIYHMYYSIRSVDEPYKIGLSVSTDRNNWERKDHEMDFRVSPTGWDSEMLCYPAVITIQQKTYLFYNGNKNGESGFGYAELAH